MTVAERLHRWNHWYDGLPQEWRFQVVLWPLILIGALNMLLSVSMRFPFGLLLLLGVLCVAAIRVPYALGWITPAEAPASGGPGTQRLEIGGAGADWLVGLNQRYEAIPEERRFWVFPAILLVAGAINMQLTIDKGWPFGLIFLIVLLAIILIRAPYAHGLLRSPSVAGTTAPALEYNARIADAHTPASANAHLPEPTTAAAPREMRPADPDVVAMPSAGMDPASEPHQRHDAAVPASPNVSTRPEMAEEPGEAGMMDNPPARPRSHPAEPNRTE